MRATADLYPLPGSSSPPSQHYFYNRPLPEGEAFHHTPSLNRLSSDRSRPITRSGSSRHDDTSRSKSRPNMITPEEYESLPPSILKKYFSSVVRLRIAQQSAVQKRKKQQPSALTEAWLSRKPSMDSLRPKTARSFKPLSIASQARRPQYFRPARTEADVDEEQALRFLALPEKVKRSHFTQEELILLTESSERALGSPSWMSEGDYQRQMTLDRNSSVCSSQFRSSDSEDMVEDLEKEWQMEVEAESVISSEQLGEKEIELQMQDAQRRHGSVCSTRSAQPATTDHRTFPRKRAMSLAPLPLPPPTLRPAVPPLPSPATFSYFSKQTHQQVNQDDTATSTKYYKDSEARAKLRECLASPEKFDEALEFGFSSERSAVERSVSVTSSSAPALQSDCDALSVSSSRDDDGREGCSTAAPRTPSKGNDLFDPNITHHSSLDSGVALPYSSIKPGVRSVSPDLCGREMTLRMTLTRPELRAPEQELYASQRKQVSGVDVETADPLALEALPFCDDHTGAHGAFAVSKSPSGGFRNVFKNFRIR